MREFFSLNGGMMRLFLVLFLFFAARLVCDGELSPVVPEALRKGDLIAVVFPASYIEAEESEAMNILQTKIDYLHLQGYQTIVYPERVNRLGYFAGSDEERARAFMDAWKNDEVKAIWCYCGGYGSQRILDYLDYEFIKTHPKILIGMSDITALHQAIMRKTGLVTFLAPVLGFFNRNDPPFFVDQYAMDSLEKVMAYEEGGNISLPPEIILETLRPGSAQGRLVGGNLSLIVSLLGTKWQLDTKDKILVLEDVSESFYKIDRMLWQLKECGLLEAPAGVILGTWHNCKSNRIYSLTLDEIFDRYFKDATYPVIKGFPTGHSRYQATLPLNESVELDADSKQVKLIVEAVSCVGSAWDREDHFG